MTLGGMSKEKTQMNLDPKTRKVTSCIDISSMTIPPVQPSVGILRRLASVCIHLNISVRESCMPIVFLGLTGFRFPFAHIVSFQIQAYDLHTLFWEAIDQLQVE
jgi:hypothetical protein